MPFSSSSMDASNFACQSMLGDEDYYLSPGDSTIYNHYLDTSYSSELDYTIESIMNQDLYPQEFLPVTFDKSTLPMDARMTSNYNTSDTTLLPQSASPSPSVCDDTPTRFSPSPEHSAPPSISPNDAKHGSAYPFPGPAPSGTRKRDRPRVKRSISDSSAYSDDADSGHKRRTPHHQVERKYRENLNAERERLRRAIPTLPQGHARLSKSMVLAGAVQYIEMLEQERRGCTCGSRKGGRR